MADELILMAEPREIHGKKVKRLRREGLIPGVVYGPVIDKTVSVSVDSRIFNKFFMAHGHSTIFSLKWDGGNQPVLIREVQVDPVRRDILHIDFFAPNMRVKLRQTVSLHLHHVPADFEEEGVLQSLLTEIEVEALPADLPSEIGVDISSLSAIGDTIHVSDIEAPANVEIMTDPGTAVATVTRQAAEEEPEVGEEEEVVEGEEAAEGEEESSDEE
jgi:large subunit ribosomal protein L25